MKKTNTKGNVSVFRFKDNETYSMADLLYVNSQHKSIERIYDFLQVFWGWSKNNTHKKSAIQVVKSAGIDYHTLGLLKKYNYIDDTYTWQLDNQPSKADAVFLRIKLKNKRKKASEQ